RHRALVDPGSRRDRVGRDVPEVRGADRRDRRGGGPGGGEEAAAGRAGEEGSGGRGADRGVSPRERERATKWLATRTPPPRAGTSTRSCRPKRWTSSSSTSRGSTAPRSTRSSA